MVYDYNAGIKSRLNAFVSETIVNILILLGEYKINR